MSKENHAGEVSFTLAQIQAMLANLDNEISGKDESEEMKRQKLPIPAEYGGGYVTGETLDIAVRNLIDRVLQTQEEAKAKKTVSFEDYFETWITMKSGQNKSPVTIANYRYIANTHLLPFFKGKNMDEIQPDDIQDYYNNIMRLSRSVSVQSKAILKGMFDRAARNELIKRNIMQYKYETSRKEGEKEVLQDDDLLNVIHSLDNLKEKDMRDYLYVCFLCFTGLRREEILGLRWKDLNFEEETIYVNNAVKFPDGQNDPIVGKPKDESCGVVRLNILLSKRIRPWQRDPADYVIPYSNEEPDKPITRSMFSKMWYRIKKSVDLKGATSHSFRASYATMVTAHCEHVDPKVLQSILRHKTPDLALKVYAKKNQAKTKRAESEYETYLLNALENSVDTGKAAQSA